jgi:hypothetical protein
LLGLFAAAVDVFLIIDKQTRVSDTPAEFFTTRAVQGGKGDRVLHDEGFKRNEKGTKVRAIQMSDEVLRGGQIQI